MCDPTIMAIASMASGVADVMGQASAQAKQKQSYDEWFAMQEKNRAEQNKKQEESRKLAEAAREQALAGVSAPSQAKAQDAEQARLDAYLQSQSGPLLDKTPTGAGETTSVADKFLLAGQQSGDDVFKSDLAAKINQAARDARGRIAALATAGSFGNSSGGLDNFTTDIFQKGAQTIDMANEFRRGDLAVYGTQQAVNPVTWTYTPGIRL